MNVRYIEFNGKHPKASKENRVYSEAPSPDWNSYGCSYDPDFLKVDIDDYNHKTEELEEPIRGKARSEAIISLLDNLNIRYNGIRTEHGKHLFFRKPETLEGKNKQNWYSPLTVKMEWKFPTSDDHIPLQVNGAKREFFRGSIENTEIDELPFFLFPLQGYRGKPFDLDFPSGDRTQKIGAYLFYLVKKEYSEEQAFQIVKLMNQFIFDDPIPEDRLIAEILNEKTLQKLKESKKDKAPSHSEVAHEVVEHFQIITANGTMYDYQGGVYIPFDESRITEYLTTMKPKLNWNFEKEVVRHIKGITRKEIPEDDNTVNVRNGILIFDNGEFRLEPHNPERISFRQFNALYNPAAEDDLLQETIFSWFNHNSEQIELFKQMVGYLMMNNVKYQKFFFLIGQPSTGKSTALNLITTFCGKQNVSHVQFSNMGDKFGLTPLVNTTANIFSDAKKGKVFSSEIFKSLSSGDPISIERKYRETIRNYIYTGKLIFGMNNFPDFSNDFDGIERRAVIFEFSKVFNQKTKGFDPDLLVKLETENVMSTLLNMAIEGYKSLIENNGFISTKESERVLKQFVTENDSVLQWLEECYIDEEFLLNEPIKASNSGLYLDYKSFCYNAGIEPKEQKDFSRGIVKRFSFSGTTTRRVSGDRYQFFKK